MNEHQAYLLEKLARSGDDSVFRARAAFAGMSEEAMKATYGASGTSRAEVLAGYEVEHARRLAAVVWLKGI